ncbi:MAG: histone-lysine N-methyltransferase EHMT1-like [Myxococcales bacterium]|nr:histone-lysine N-methyltransferase EHMT1-like [Myxococcales bacterium]
MDARVGAVPAVDAKDASGWTALQHAAMAGDLAQISSLLAQGASLEASSPKVYDGATAFAIALQFSQAAAAKLLLDRGASVAGAIGTVALVLAARDDDDAMLDALLARGVPVKGTRAVTAAAKYGRVSALKRLIKVGAAVDTADAGDHDFTPLMVACMENQLEAARVLLAAGARVNARDDDGSTVLHWAVFGARPVEIHLYMEMGEPHDTVWEPRPTAPVVELLIQRGADINATDKSLNTPLHQAAMMDARVAAELLVAAGADRNARNRDGKIALELATDRHNSVEQVLRPRSVLPRP